MRSDKKPVPLARLKYVGGDDVFFAGVPRSDIEVGEDPKSHGQVNLDLALTLIASGLYQDADGRVSQDDAKKLIAPPEESIEAAAAAATPAESPASPVNQGEVNAGG